MLEKYLVIVGKASDRFEVAHLSLIPVTINSLICLSAEPYFQFAV